MDFFLDDNDVVVVMLWDEQMRNSNRLVLLFFSDLNAKKNITSRTPYNPPTMEGALCINSGLPRLHYAASNNARDPGLLLRADSLEKVCNYPLSEIDSKLELRQKCEKSHFSDPGVEGEVSWNEQVNMLTYNSLHIYVVYAFDVALTRPMIMLKETFIKTSHALPFT